MLSGIFGLKRKEVTGEWRELNSEGLHIFYALPGAVRVIKSRRIRWARHVADMGDMTVTYRT